MTPASTSDIAVRWRPLSEAEEINAHAFLDDAWELLLGRRPSLEADMEAEVVSYGNVVRVLVAMVLRIMKNPDGLLEESIDDYRYRRDALVSSGALYVTDAELADVSPSSGRRRRSVRLVVYGDA